MTLPASARGAVPADPRPARHGGPAGPLRAVSSALGACALLLLSAAPAAADPPDAPPPAAGTDPAAPAPEAVDALVEAYREATGLPGAAVVLTRGTDVVHVGGYGTTPDGTPVTGRTPMALASVSKSFTALAVLRLAEAGELDLDDPVREHLPEFTMADPRAERITVRQLLDQTSGMSDTEFASYSRGRETLTLRGSVADLRDVRLAAEPGTRWEYHNPNYQVAARLVEVVGGRPFADHLREEVFAPLGMDATTTIDTDLDLPADARGHIVVLGLALPADEPPGFGNGSGGVVGSAEDMGAWLIAHSTGGRGPGGAETGLLSPGGFEELHTPSEASGSYALGWSLGETASGAPVVEHSGQIMTATSHQALLPDSGYGIAVMANSGTSGAGASGLADALIELVDSGAAPERPGDEGAWAAWTDAALLSPAVAAVPLGVRGVRRAGGWALARSGRPRWATAVRLLPYALPPTLFVSLHEVLGWLFQGRDMAWFQPPYLFPAFWAALAVCSLGCCAVLAARVGHLAAVAGAGRPRNPDRSPAGAAAPDR
ncbi:Protein flp [Nocardiopsis dassonvillei]|uniref:serine hydrolase domain-containing protein n=1 Tax=Nocardiopsis dassonvillei TaxID=2014 RepID=UPI003F577489